MLKSDSGRQLLAAIDALSMHHPYFSSAISETLLDQFLRSKPSSPTFGLTHREREVVQLIAEGKINKEIGEALNISVKTVYSKKHKIQSRLEAVLGASFAGNTNKSAA